MRRPLLICLSLSLLTACTRDSEPAEPAPGAARCVPYGARQMRCSIGQLSDCQEVRDYPYARNLFCPAAFSAAQTMAAALARSLDVPAPSEGVFHYYQTLADPNAPPDDQAQTTEACLITRAPWGSTHVVGAGAPLCRLIAYVTSPGPTALGGAPGGNPIPAELRNYPDYFVGLFLPAAPSLPSDFRAGTAFDPRVRSLGARARDGFLADYPAFASDRLYDPAGWQADTRYHGISGGGGGGWGGEIVVEPRGAEADVLLTFGGGGGGGMTSTRGAQRPTSRVGGGGGGGVQFGDDFLCRDQRCGGLGLGAGVGSEAGVQYSYFDYAGSERAPQPVHEFNPALVADYQAQLANLVAQLSTRLRAGETIVLRGGGGMGGGAEYLMENGEEYAPHALSTQAGFQFRYAFSPSTAPAAPQPRDLDAEQGDAYARLGLFYRTATTQAFDKCGRDYSNYACLCPATHAIVLGLMADALGGAAKLPTWLRQRHCPDDSTPAGADAVVGAAAVDRAVAARGPIDAGLSGR